jgi:hypothetical protein
MTAIEEARAVAAELDRAVDACDIWAAWTHMAAGRDALRALIAEHADCDHEAWEENGRSRRCADCKEALS